MEHLEQITEEKICKTHDCDKFCGVAWSLFCEDCNIKQLKENLYKSTYDNTILDK